MARRDADLLAKVPLFAGLPKRHLRAVAGLATEQDFAENATIAREGMAGDDDLSTLPRETHGRSLSQFCQGSPNGWVRPNFGESH